MAAVLYTYCAMRTHAAAPASRSAWEARTACAGHSTAENMAENGYRDVDTLHVNASGVSLDGEEQAVPQTKAQQVRKTIPEICKPTLAA